MKKLLPVALVLAAGLLPACASSLPVLRGQAQERLNMSDWEGALKKYDEVLAKAPDDPQANYGRGVCLLNMGQPQQAETSLRRALAVMGHDSRMSPAICDRIAEAKVAQKDLAGFTEFVGGEVKRHGTSRDWLRQAKGLAAFGDADGAVSAFRQAEVRACDEANEDRYAVYIATADYYLSMRDQPSALRCTRYAAYLNHNKPEIEGRLKKLGRVPGPTEYVAPPTKAELLGEKQVVETK